ncbi:hypothetical protein [Falsibacillus albus]|uniref:Uncharacterized protein n=1 Tax=Falsibacillus albus TaxID=2478915 RepID=A0A3L7JYM4_9BACI|nr:hypothetical protein [Falsibacillus albus]RLQ95907.1 hypothetical protein D9X91_09835 [Falsibacillus albus]
MKSYIAFLVQLMVWSSFTLVEWLSKHDHKEYKILMFAVFFYLAFIIARAIVKSRKRTLIITLVSLSIYASFHIILQNYLALPILSIHL